MPNTNIQLGQKHHFSDDQGKSYKIGAHSDVIHTFYSGKKPWNTADENDTWIIAINGENGVIDVGRQQVDGKILVRNGDQAVTLILDGKTGETQQLGDMQTHGDVLVLHNGKIMIRLDGANGDLLLGGGTPDESHIWLQSAQGNAYLGGNIRLEGGVGQATLGNPVIGSGSGANGILLLNNVSGSTRIRLAGEKGNGQFAGSVSVGDMESFPEQLHVEGKTVIAGPQSELLVAGNAGIGTTETHEGERLHVAGKTVIDGTGAELLVNGNMGVGVNAHQSERLYVKGSTLITGDGAGLRVDGSVEVITTTSDGQDPALHVKGPAVIESGAFKASPAPELLTDFNVHGNSRLKGLLEIDGNVGIGAAPPVVQDKDGKDNGRAQQVFHDKHAAVTAHSSGNTHIGIGANAKLGNMIHWDPAHDLSFGTKDDANGNSALTREIIRAGKDGIVWVGGIELDGNQGDIRLPNADCAEDFDVAGPDDLEPGTVVVIEDEGRLVQSTSGYDRRVAGVISGAGGYRPGIVLDQQHDAQTKRAPVALMGKVFCKVDADVAPIAVGDLLTSASTPGHAMKATDPIRAFGAVIGKALRALPSGKCLIPVLVALQ